MAWVVSFAGQKGGTGKSMLSQAFAVSSINAGETVTLADFDVGQRTSFEWNEARKLNKITPPVRVVLVDPDRHADFGVAQAQDGASLLVIDAPGWSDQKTLMLAGYSDVMVLPTGASVADLRPTIRLMHELVGGGAAQSKISPALCRVKTDAEISFAREYLKDAGFQCLNGVLRDMPNFRTLQNQGYAAIEARGDKMRDEAVQLMDSIHAALALERGRQERKPLRFVPRPERLQERGR